MAVLTEKVTLTAAGGTLAVTHSSVSFERTMDAVGQSSSRIQRCVIKLTVVADDTKSLCDWLLAADPLQKGATGTITYMSAGDKTVKKITYTDGYIQSFNEYFASDGVDGNSAVLADLVIMSREVDLDGSKFKAQWSSKPV